MKKVMIIAALTLIALAAYGHKKESLALFPFTGGNGTDGESIVSSLARRRELRDAFNKVTPVTQNTIKTMNFEQKFQRDSGLTDADTIFELGKRLNASHVIAGYITRLGNQNLVLVSILDVESLQQVAGDYRVYQTIEDVDALIPDIARKLSEGSRRDTRGLPGLSVPPFVISGDVNQSDAQVLAQILACDLANGTKYAVLPRTDSLEKALDEHSRQRTGETDQERVKRLGVGRNAQYVLSGAVERMGRLNKFAADVLDINDGGLIEGYEERYTAFSEGVDLIPKLAAALNGTSPAAARAPSIPANFVWVAPGTFSMGSNSGYSYELLVHSVTISQGFYLSDHEVTHKEWVEAMGGQSELLEGGQSASGDGELVRRDRVLQQAEREGRIDARVHDRQDT
jgi:TolB-like protein